MKSEIRLINYRFQYLHILRYMVILCFIGGCNKNNPVSGNENFTHVYALDGNQNCAFAGIENNNGFFIVGTQDLILNNDNKSLRIWKTDMAGKQLWTKSIPDSIPNPLVKAMRDGSFLICSSEYPGQVQKIDREGNIIFKSAFTAGWYDYFSFPFQNEDGSFLIACTNGGNVGSASGNRVDKFQSNGTRSSYLYITDSSLTGKVLYLDLYHYEEPETYYFCGLILNKKPWSWKDNARIFVAKQNYSGTQINSSSVLIIDSANETNNNQIGSAWSTLIHVVTPEKSLVLVNVQGGIKGENKGFIVKVDSSLHKLWEKDLVIGRNGTYPRDIVLDLFGNYLISGSCLVEDKNTPQPFACKLDANGNLLWWKIYFTSLSGFFNYGTELSDGSLLFGGTTNGFGKGVNLNDVFIMKTDRVGNLK